MRYAKLFALMGVSLGFLALNSGAWGYLLFWFALDFIILAVGYGGVGDRVYSKSAEGRIPWWVWIVFLPYLIYSNLVWHVMRIFLRENAYDEVSDGIILGRRLLASETPLGIRNWVDLTAEFIDCKSQRDSHNYICLPVLDASVPDKQAIDSAIALIEPGLTYIHCAQGHGRTGLFALALLAHRGIISSVEEGMALICDKRPGIGLNAVQMEFIGEYINEVVASKEQEK